MERNGFAKEEVLFVRMVRKYLPYWPWFVASTIFFLFVGFLYLRYTAPMYEATASLIIKDEKKGNEDAKFLESLNLVASKKIIENEIEVLKSRRVIDSVIKRLHLYAPVYFKGKIHDISAYQVSPVYIEASDMESLIATDLEFSFSVDKLKNQIHLSDGSAFPIGTWIKMSFGEVRFMPTGNSNTSEKKIFFFRIADKKKIADQLLDRLKVTAANKLSSVIELKYRDVLPALSEDILNGIMSSYNSILLSEKDILAKNTLSFIDSRLSVVSNDLDQIEKKMEKFKGNRGAVDIGTQGQLFLQNVSANDQRLTELSMQLSVIDQIQEQLRSENNIALLPASLGLNDPALTQLMTSLNNYQLDKEKLRKTVAENNPMLVAISDQIEDTRNRIAENLKTYRKSIEAGKVNIIRTNESYNGLLQTIPEKEMEILGISRDQSIKNGIYSFLLQKKEESELMHASKIAESRLVNYAQASDDPVTPNKLVLLSCCLLAIFSFPVGIVSAREALNPSVLFRQEIETFLSFPVIGEVTHNRKADTFVVEEGKRSYAAEEFRKIRYSIKHLSDKDSLKRILVTSSISGEGKSFIAANLAISFSLSGKKVLLIDFDLHNSSLAGKFGLDNMPGITDYLLGHVQANAIPYAVNDFPGLSFIGPGLIHQNPSELLEESKVRKFLESFTHIFDLIIIDAPPAALVTDAYLLSAMCDKTLYVIRHGYTPKSLLKRFSQINSATPLKNPFAIYNGVKSRGYLKNEYGYGYGYVYGDAYQRHIRGGRGMKIAG